MPFADGTFDLFTPPEAAALLHVCRATLDNLHRRNQGPCRTVIGARVFYKRNDLEDYIAERTEKEKQAPAEGDLVALIEAELLESTPSFNSPEIRPWVNAVAAAIAALRQIDLNVRNGDRTEDRAAFFVKAIQRLSHELLCFDHVTRHESLAGCVVAGAAITAAQVFADMVEKGLNDDT